MSTPAPRRHCRKAFSLVELLTVVGIIALLIGILIPALSAARNEARRGAAKALLASIDRGLETFSGAMGGYPNSALAPDPITDIATPGSAKSGKLSGAHWLARAMVGHDGLGVDYAGRSAKSGDGTYVKAQFDGGITPKGPYAQRRGVYIDKGETYAIDTEIGYPQGNPAANRLMLIDPFKWPILYYKANTRAPKGFAEVAQPAKGDDKGIYVQEDNAEITGGKVGSSKEEPWDFASAGAPKKHGLGYFVDAGDTEAKPPAGYAGRTFISYLHDHAAHESSGASASLTATMLKPVRADSYVLISAGPDGVLGTTDDVTNFK